MQVRRPKLFAIISRLWGLGPVGFSAGVLITVGWCAPGGGVGTTARENRFFGS